MVLRDRVWVVVASHWLSCSDFSLARSFLGEEKIFLHPSRVCKGIWERYLPAAQVLIQIMYPQIQGAFNDYESHSYFVLKFMNL